MGRMDLLVGWVRYRLDRVLKIKSGVRLRESKSGHDAATNSAVGFIHTLYHEVLRRSL